MTTETPKKSVYLEMARTPQGPFNLHRISFQSVSTVVLVRDFAKPTLIVGDVVSRSINFYEKKTQKTARFSSSTPTA